MSNSITFTLDYKLKWNNDYVPYLIGWTHINHSQCRVDSVEEFELGRIKEFIEHWMNSIAGVEFYEKTYSFKAIKDEFNSKLFKVDFQTGSHSRWKVTAKNIVVGKEGKDNVYGIQFIAKEL